MEQLANYNLVDYNLLVTLVVIILPYFSEEFENGVNSFTSFVYSGF